MALTSAELIEKNAPAVENVDIDNMKMNFDSITSQDYFQVKPSTSFAKVKQFYAKHTGKSESSIRFKFQGRLIDDKDTPKSLGLRQHSDGKMKEIQVDCLDDLTQMKHRIEVLEELEEICRENPCAEDIERLKQELFAKARKRKDAARERSEKKVKTVSTTGDREAPYDLEKVLKTLGETESKDNHKNKRKEAKTGKKKSRRNKKEEDTTVATSEQIKFNESLDKDRIDVKDAFENDIGIITSESNEIKNDIETVPGLSQSSYERGAPTSNTLGKHSLESHCEFPEQQCQGEQCQNQAATLQKVHNEIVPNIEKLMKKYEKLKIEKQDLEDARLCKICMEAEICCVFIPCGHQVTCEDCAKNLSVRTFKHAVSGELKKCPVCREQISQYIKTYLP